MENRIDFGNGFSINLDLQRWIDQGLRVGGLGASGAGKSYLMGVLLEELIRLYIPALVIDSEGEYISLKEIAPDRVVIAGHRGELMLGELELIFAALDLNKVVVVNLNTCDDEIKLRAYESLVGQLLAQQERRREMDQQSALMLIVEEAMLYAPKANAKSKLALDLTNKVVQGRKEGIHSWFIVPQPGQLHPAILAQFNLYIIGRLENHIDFNAIRGVLPTRFLNPQTNQMDEVTLNTLQSLETGEFFLRMGSRFDRIKRVRQRKARDLAKTPALKAAEAKQKVLLEEAPSF